MKSILVLFFALLVPSTFAASCLDYPSFLSKGASCSGGFCGNGLYCDNKFLCSPIIEDGSKCIPTFGGCGPQSTCKGPESKEICVKNAGPGDSCSSDNSVTTASCGNGLSCSFASSRCVGGHYGDRCAANADCRSGVCGSTLCALPATIANNTCSSPNGDNDICGKDYYCAYNGFFAYSCQPRLAVGAQCDSSAECPISHSCAKKKESDEFSFCIAPASLDAGAWCEGYDSLCKSGICADYFCATTYPVYCEESWQCGSEGLCMCGSNTIIYSNIGLCKKNPCLEQYNAYQQCLSEKCLGESYSDYYSSCASINCQVAIDDVTTCSSKKFKGFYDL